MSLHKDDLLNLVQQYNVPGPRYTSYPTAVQFSEEFDKSELEDNFKRRRESEKPLSLYIHIPFCFSLCWYCGCTKIITKDQNRGDIYLDYLDKEMALVSKTTHPLATLKQIHFGGGTPTFLDPKQIRRLGQLIKTYFTLHNDVEFSVEIDPRRCSEEHIIALAEIGCNRASLGVQDTNEEVQKAIHRIQPFEKTAEVTELLRKHGINSINFDLIYGLPKQSIRSFKKTIEDVVHLEPDRFAIYSYAHIPSIMPAQKLLDEADFPSTHNKLGMLVHAIEKLPDYGYSYIGMDHFAKESDELSKALKEGTLQRNFQGYSTHAELEMIALGMSSISQGPDLYCQNDKDLNQYYAALDDGKLPVKKILRLSEEDKIRKTVIMHVMCRGGIDYSELSVELGIPFTDHFSDELENLKQLEADGLLLLTPNGFNITSTGRLFLRNIAMVFDGYLTQSRHKAAYSKTV
ncbi:MAG: oxygen-independent coproporphyrinogen III oxidase [Balneolaceae bacterium]|nr:oxygen-independent coproporphyrinogen III oxidase [Balneolaceae bacterium]